MSILSDTNEGHLLTLEVAAALIPMASKASLCAWLSRRKELFPPRYTCIGTNCSARKHQVRRLLTEDEVLTIRGLVILHDRARCPVPGKPRKEPRCVGSLFEKVPV